MAKPSKRDQLIEATKELLWQVGYESMSPRDIQEHSKARPGSLYHHFPSKLALAGEAMSQVAESDIARINNFFAGDLAPKAKIEQYLRAERQSKRGCRFGRLVNETAIEHEELSGPVKSFFEAIRSNLRSTLRAAQDEGTLRSNVNPDDLAVTLLAAIQGAAVLARCYQDDSIAQQAMEGALSMLTQATSPN